MRHLLKIILEFVLGFIIVVFSLLALGCAIFYVLGIFENIPNTGGIFVILSCVSFSVFCWSFGAEVLNVAKKRLNKAIARHRRGLK